MTGASLWRGLCRCHRRIPSTSPWRRSADAARVAAHGPRSSGRRLRRRGCKARAAVVGLLICCGWCEAGGCGVVVLCRRAPPRGPHVPQWDNARIVGLPGT
eukprot:scaffold22443_cov112-Isochrysis_galbana.AAC.1